MKKIFAIAIAAIALMAIACKPEGNNANNNVDKTELTALIAQAKTLVQGASTATYPQAAIDEFNTTISAVEGAVNQATTAASVASLVSRLNDAITTFKESAVDAIKNADIIFKLSFDEGEGTELKTTGKNQWTAKLQKGAEELFPETKLPEFVDGKVGKALHFADASHLSIADYDAAALTGIKNISIACWVKPDELRASNYIVSLQTWHVWKFQTQDGGKPFFTIATDKGVTDMDNESDGSVAVGRWDHIAVTWASETGEVKFYVNGELTKTWDKDHNGGKHGVGTSIAAISQENVELAIGSDETIGMKRGTDNAEISAWDAYFHGAIDELAVYSVALSQGQITKLYNDQK